MNGNMVELTRMKMCIKYEPDWLICSFGVRLLIGAIPNVSTKLI